MAIDNTKRSTVSGTTDNEMCSYKANSTETQEDTNVQDKINDLLGYINNNLVDLLQKNIETVYK